MTPKQCKVEGKGGNIALRISIVKGKTYRGGEKASLADLSRRGKRGLQKGKKDSSTRADTKSKEGTHLREKGPTNSSRKKNDHRRRRGGRQHNTNSTVRLY